VYDHDVVPVASRQVAPPSVDTSTAATVPPTSLAVPVTVTSVCCTTLAPPVGAVMVDVGAVWSLVAVAAESPARSVCGWTPMSARMFTVACWRSRSSSVCRLVSFSV
jgi:hypothetical protein